jgi:hypothetical protein
MMTAFLLLTISLFALPPEKPDLTNNRFEIHVQRDHSWIVKETGKNNRWHFRPDFIVLTSPEDPKMAMRPAGIENVMYNVVTWQASELAENDALKQAGIGDEVAGDGFDDRILKGKTGLRTADVFKAGKLTRHTARRHRKDGNK